MTKSAFAVAGLSILACIAVFAFGTQINNQAVVTVRRNVREILGLPKFWITSFNDDTSRYMPLACPKDAIVIVSGGQSNAANSYDPASPPDGNKDTFMFYAGRCFKLQSPVLGSTGDLDSLWPALGSRINYATGKPVVFINGAVGGTQIGDFLDDRSHYLSRLVTQISQAERLGLRPSFFIWIQGETDAAVQLRPETYAQEQLALIDKVKAEAALDEGTRWVIDLSTRCKNRPTNGEDIENALEQLASHSNGRIIIGPRITGYDDSFRHDTCHLNTRGRDRLVEETFQTLKLHHLLPER